VSWHLFGLGFLLAGPSISLVFVRAASTMDGNNPSKKLGKLARHGQEDRGYST
jgi:hypothetical protein